MVYYQEPEPLRDYLFTDGYIAATVGTTEAKWYFNRLLQFDERHLGLVILRGAFNIIHPTVQHAQPSKVDNQPAWLLDYILCNYGTVIPQSIYPPTTAVGRTKGHRNPFDMPLRMPIFFVRGQRQMLGLKLPQAASGDLEWLRNKDVTAPLENGNSNTTSIRIMWPGYGEWRGKIMIRDKSPAKNTITLETLAKSVASVVCRFLEIAGWQCQRPAWRIGGQGGITADNVYLIGLINVCEGIWQPILQLNCHIEDSEPYDFPNVLSSR